MAQIRKRIGDIIETDVDDETVVVQLETGDMYSLAGTARTIWKMLDKEADAEAIVRSLADRHGGARDRIAADLSEFCSDMQDAGLVQTR